MLIDDRAVRAGAQRCSDARLPTARGWGELIQGMSGFKKREGGSEMSSSLSSVEEEGYVDTPFSCIYMSGARRCVRMQANCRSNMHSGVTIECNIIVSVVSVVGNSC